MHRSERSVALEERQQIGDDDVVVVQHAVGVRVGRTQPREISREQTDVVAADHLLRRDLPPPPPAPTTPARRSRLS
jgi:hypothetical protein